MDGQDVEVRPAREKRTHYRATYEDVPLAYFSLGPDARIRTCNRRAGALLQYAPEELVGQFFFDVCAETEHGEPKAKRLFERVWSGETVTDEEVQMQCADGMLVWINLTAHAVRGDDGTVDECRWTAVDVTDRKRMERVLREREELYRSLVRNMSDVITVLDRDGVVQYQSPSVRSVLGYTPDELVGEDVFSYVHPDDVTCVRNAFLAARDNPDVTLSVELRFRHKDGSWRTLEASGRNHLDHPAIRGIVTTSRDVTERQEAEQALRQYAKRLEIQQDLTRTLQQVGSLLTSELGVEEVLERILDLLGRVVEYDAAALQLSDDGEQLRVVAWQGESELAEARQVVHTLSRRVLEQSPCDRAVVVSDLSDDKHLSTLDLGHVRSWVGAPLLVKRRLIGLLNVYSRTPDAYDAAMTDTVMAFANQAAVAIENARLFEVEQQRHEMTAALLDIMHTASSSLELTEVLKRVCQRTATVCHASRCSIFLLNKESSRLEPVMSQFADGRVDEDLWKTFLRIGAERVESVPLFRNTIRERRPLLLETPADSDLVPHTSLEPFGVETLLAVPLIARDRVIGLMVLDHTDPYREFSSEQIDLAVTIGGRVAASIENARLYTRMQELALTDSLTGLYNRRGFFELGRREVERARRFGRPLAILMVDIDRFKPVNDRYGHPAGDTVLTQFAARCRDLLRQTDLLGRYGGEEFVVLLPETDAREAEAVAERLRRGIEATSFETEEAHVHITVSIGISLLRETDADLESVIKRADLALNRAKRSGRNRVSRWHK